MALNRSVDADGAGAHRTGDPVIESSRNENVPATANLRRHPRRDRRRRSRDSLKLEEHRKQRKPFKRTIATHDRPSPRTISSSSGVLTRSSIRKPGGIVQRSEEHTSE